MNLFSTTLNWPYTKWFLSFLAPQAKTFLPPTSLLFLHIVVHEAVSYIIDPHAVAPSPDALDGFIFAPSTNPPQDMLPILTFGSCQLTCLTQNAYFWVCQISLGSFLCHESLNKTMKSSIRRPIELVWPGRNGIMTTYVKMFMKIFIWILIYLMRLNLFMLSLILFRRNLLFIEVQQAYLWGFIWMEAS